MYSYRSWIKCTWFQLKTEAFSHFYSGNCTIWLKWKTTVYTANTHTCVQPKLCALHSEKYSFQLNSFGLFNSYFEPYVIFQYTENRSSPHKFDMVKWMSVNTDIVWQMTCNLQAYITVSCLTLGLQQKLGWLTTKVPPFGFHNSRYGTQVSPIGSSLWKQMYEHSIRIKIKGSHWLHLCCYIPST